MILLLPAISISLGSGDDLLIFGEKLNLWQWAGVMLAILSFFLLSRSGKKEGIVIRPTQPVFSASIGAELSMKVVSNKYLLKNDG